MSFINLETVQTFVSVLHVCYLLVRFLHGQSHLLFAKNISVLVPLGSQKTISKLKAELEKGPQDAAVYTQQIHQLQSNLDNLQQQSQVHPHMKYTNRLVM